MNLAAQRSAEEAYTRIHFSWGIIDEEDLLTLFHFSGRLKAQGIQFQTEGNDHCKHAKDQYSQVLAGSVATGADQLQAEHVSGQ